jgi:hypothetical protein
MNVALAAVFDKHNALLNDGQTRGVHNTQHSKQPTARKPAKPKRQKPGSKPKPPPKPRATKAAPTPKFSFNSAHRKMAIPGIQRVILTMQEVVRKRLILDSWSRTGLYPFSMKQMMSMIRVKDISKEQQDLFEAQVPVAAALFHANGELTTAQIQATGIASSIQRKSSVDGLVPYRRRAIELTHPAFILRERELYYEPEPTIVLSSDGPDQNTIVYMVEEEVASAAVAVPARQLRQPEVPRSPNN